jgi:hypothetical protein
VNRMAVIACLTALLLPAACAAALASRLLAQLLPAGPAGGRPDLPGPRRPGVRPIPGTVLLTGAHHQPNAVRQAVQAALSPAARRFSSPPASSRRATAPAIRPGVPSS